MPKAKMELDSFFREVAELAQHALNKREYEYPFVTLVVGADCSVTGFEFVADQSPPQGLFEQTSQLVSYLYPLTLFFYCAGKRPFSAMIRNPGEQAVCRL